MPTTGAELSRADGEGAWLLRRSGVEHGVHTCLVAATGASLAAAWAMPILGREVEGSFIEEVRGTGRGPAYTHHPSPAPQQPGPLPNTLNPQPHFPRTRVTRPAHLTPPLPPGQLRDAAAAAGSSASSLTGEFNLLTLGLLCGRSNGWDYVSSLHALTFFSFVVIGPAVRTLSELVLLLLDLPPAVARRLLALSRYSAAFYGLDVMLVAVPLLQQTVSNMSDGMFTPKTFVLCTEPGCFELRATPLGGYAALAVTVGLFYFSGFEGSLTHRYLHAAAHPDDRPPPDCCNAGRSAGTAGEADFGKGQRGRVAAVGVAMQ
jgi:hypothetical protein